MEQEVEGQIQAIKEGRGSSSNLKSFLSGYRSLITPAQLPLRLRPCIAASRGVNHTRKRSSLPVQCRHQNAVHGEAIIQSDNFISVDCCRVEQQLNALKANGERLLHSDWEISCTATEALSGCLSEAQQP